MLSNATQILIKLENDPTYFNRLYEALYFSDFITLVKPGTQNEIYLTEFLTYPTLDGIQELPLFTEDDFILNFSSIQILILKVKGIELWPRLLNIIETEKYEVAINPGKSHGIRLNNSMILGMISMYSK